jgi:hypothetical protein
VEILVPSKLVEVVSGPVNNARANGVPFPRFREARLFLACWFPSGAAFAYLRRASVIFNGTPQPFAKATPRSLAASRLPCLC